MVLMHGLLVVQLVTCRLLLTLRVGKVALEPRDKVVLIPLHNRRRCELRGRRQIGTSGVSTSGVSTCGVEKYMDVAH